MQTGTDPCGFGCNIGNGVMGNLSKLDSLPLRLLHGPRAERLCSLPVCWRHAIYMRIMVSNKRNSAFHLHLPFPFQVDLKGTRLQRTKKGWPDPHRNQRGPKVQGTLERRDWRERKHAPMGPPPISKIRYSINCFVVCIRLLVPESSFACAITVRISVLPEEGSISSTNSPFI